MPQNWWELFPEVQPSPFARRRLLPGPGGMVSEPPMAPPMAAPYAAPGPDPAPPGAFDPAYFSGGQPGIGQFPNRFPGLGMSVGHPQPPLGRSATVQQAAAAIQAGADPKAVRARLQEMKRGDPGLDKSNPFSDLLPEDQPGFGSDPIQGLSGGKAGAPFTQVSMQRLEIEQDRRIADQIARERGGDAELADDIFRDMRGLPPRAPRNSLPSEPAVHAAPVLNDHRLPNPSHVEGEDIVVTGPPRAAREALRQGVRIIRLTPEDVLNLKKLVQTEWVQRAGTDQARGIIDTALNRLASGHFGSTISGVVNQRNQFSAINGPYSEGRHSVEEYPISRLSRAVNDFVDAYLAERANGAPSIIGTNLNYANPVPGSGTDPQNMPWVRRLDGPTLGVGRAIHRHGTTPENQRYRPGPYSIVLPRPVTAPPGR